jgi:hypothetical protein
MPLMSIGGSPWPAMMLVNEERVILSECDIQSVVDKGFWARKESGA